ncbi:MAG: hypothetical protein J6C31_02020 [Prevotella sp.]|nr:hypothetical protein [Prevotella sp.]
MKNDDLPHVLALIHNPAFGFLFSSRMIMKGWRLQHNYANPNSSFFILNSSFIIKNDNERMEVAA